MIITDLLQWSEFPVSCSLFPNQICSLYIRSFARFCAYEIYLTGSKNTDLHLVSLSKCLFGEHLLSLCPDLPVALVEAEKTAVICSAVIPEFLWLANGGLGQFNDRVKVLLGRQVIAFPNISACDRWRKKAKDYPLLDITVSDYLEKNATPQQREMGADLADWVVEERS